MARMQKIENRIPLTKSRSSLDRYYLLNDGRGMGGYGEPEGHHSHSWLVVCGIDRGNGYQGYMSVDYFLAQEWAPEDAKKTVIEVLGL